MRNDYAYDYIYIALDPSGGGGNSDYAITSLIKYRGQYIVIGMESTNYLSLYDGHALLINHIRKLDENPIFERCKKVLILENNLGNTAETFATALDDNLMSHSYMLLEDPTDKKRYGVRTSNNVKEMGVEHIRELLYEGRLIISEDLVCTQRSVPDIVETLKNQMSDFSECVLDRKNEKPTRKFSGKGPNGVRKDDLMMSFLLCCIWSNYFMKNDRGYSTGYLDQYVKNNYVY